jgi:hypothetical protein
MPLGGRILDGYFQHLMQAEPHKDTLVNFEHRGTQWLPA